jgi:hypothetical protein
VVDVEGSQVARVAGYESEVEGGHDQALRAETAKHATTSRDGVPSPPTRTCVLAGAPVGALRRPVRGPH